MNDLDNIPQLVKDHLAKLAAWYLWSFPRGGKDVSVAVGLMRTYEMNVNQTSQPIYMPVMVDNLSQLQRDYLKPTLFYKAWWAKPTLQRAAQLRMQSTIVDWNYEKSIKYACEFAHAIQPTGRWDECYNAWCNVISNDRTMVTERANRKPGYRHQAPKATRVGRGYYLRNVKATGVK